MGKVSSEKEQINVAKVTLGTGKIVLLREIKVKDHRLAAKAVGNREMNQLETALAYQDELLKLILVQIDDEVMTHDKKNDLSKLFSVQEWKALQKVLKQMDGDEEGELQVEFATI